MARIPLVDLHAQYDAIKPSIDDAIQRVIGRTSFIQGPEVAEFERQFAGVAGAKAAVGVASGTAAVELALRAVGVGPGDEVITSAHTFFATAEAIWQVGARPVFADIDQRRYTLDPNAVEDAITPRTRAIVPVHLYGQAADMAPLAEIADRRDLWLIEDAAQAHAAEYRGQRCGSLGDLGCFSFYPGKNLGAYGDAGAVTGDDESLIAKIRLLRDHGRTTKYEHEAFGFNARLDTLQAAILGAKLPYLERWTEARRAHARLYDELLAGSGVTTPYAAPEGRHVYHIYAIRTAGREMLLEKLRAKGIAAGIHYPVPLHRQPACLKEGYGAVALPITEQVAGEILSLPMYPELTQEQIEYVAHAITEAD
jgi:dTDP-4-amino-4,6-dideoxygalactose transaminase